MSVKSRAILAVVVYIATVGTVVYVAAHFIGKYW
jgi:hypothetical protein